MKNVKIVGVMKITIPLRILPAYICPTPGMIKERITATNSSFLE